MQIQVRHIGLGILVLAFGVLPALAQYSEIYKLDKATTGIDDRQVLNRFSEKTGVPVDTLSQQKTQHNLTYGQLFLIHSIAKSAGKDFETIASQHKSGKMWSALVNEHGVQMREIQTTARDLEKLLKQDRKLRRAATK